MCDLISRTIRCFRDGVMRQPPFLMAAIILALTVSMIVPAHSRVHLGLRCPEEQKKWLCISQGALDYIYIYDEITQSTADEIARIDGRLPPTVKFPKVYLNSFGGSEHAAIQIARILRRREAVVENKDMFFPSKYAVCFSACVTIAAGGVFRRLTHIGIHQGHVREIDMNRQVTRRGYDDFERRHSREFWAEMGISNEINEIEDVTSHESMAEFVLDPYEPPEEQVIVQLGFWMGALDGSDGTRMGDQANSLDLMVSAWERGDSWSAYIIGSRLSSGAKGFPLDTEQAKVWLKRAGEAGIPYAWHELGVLLDSKRNSGGPDRIEAVKYFRKAAEAGFAGSQNNLGWYYYKGEGIAKNYAEAIYWLTRAVEQGEPFAYGSLGDMRFHEAGFERNDVETYKWLKLAVDNLPLGDARDNDMKLFEAVKARMSRKDIAIAEARAKTWKPLRQTHRLIGNKED